MKSRLPAVIPLLLPMFLSQVLSQDPGVPNTNPSISYWQIPPLKGIADHQSEQLPAEADIVIIGSGLTGTSVAWHLLKEHNGTRPLRIAMVEARQACSGATGRNGGQIRPAPYLDHFSFKEDFSDEEAVKITKFQVAHVEALLSAANSLPEEGRQAAEARTVDSIDAFFNEEEWKSVVKMHEDLKKELPEVAREFTVLEKDEARKTSFLHETVGAMAGSQKMSGAIWAYRFVTHALKSLLDENKNFTLDTNTAAHNVSSVTDPSVPFNYKVSTSRGDILTNNVVHATNAYVPHLVPGFRGVIGGELLHMSAQLGGSGLPRAGQWPSLAGNGSLPGGRAWTLFRNGLESNFDYAVQLPRNGEFMFGGGPGVLWDDDVENPANASFFSDSGPLIHSTAAYLNGALPNYFGAENWGSERTDFPQPEDGDVWPGRIKGVWVGIESRSSDYRPYVGRLPETVTTRPAKNAASGGEWVASGYDGEGMTFAWLSGRALSHMIAVGSAGGNEPDAVPEWFPQSFLITQQRLDEQESSSESEGKSNSPFVDKGIATFWLLAMALFFW
ncbi:hypothetical protein CMUS01_15304 [Colletotrichum musicola]|uniref:FAD dependent oxidoreductase domain-containing protein n=1 Tax=Colletotrichum musicola TaxID=2175873 RepID=A0A8H6MMV1_9PEZI|nr:hypothetical protein CMUS01_15304 [Colletotrichum musicola]